MPEGIHPDRAMRFLATFVLLNAFTLSAATYTVLDLGLLPGFESSHATDLNDRGQVVGWLETSNNVSRAFLWERGRLKILSQGGWMESVASSINSRGEIVGACVQNGARHSFLWRNEEYLDLGQIDRFPRLGLPGRFVAGGVINDRSRVATRLTIPDGNQRTAVWSAGKAAFFGLMDDGRICHGLAMNNHDQIAGQVFDTNQHSRPFIWRDGEFIELGSLGGTRASATEINDHGTVIGWALPEAAKLNEAHAFVWNSNDGLHDLGTLGGKSSRAYGLNNRGQIVGYSQNAKKVYVACLWEDGQPHDLNAMIETTGWKLISAGAINDQGQIIASAFPPDGGDRREVLLAPKQFIAPKYSPLATFAPGETSEFNLTSFERLPNGSFRLGFAGVPGGEYAVEVSANLKSWRRLGLAENNNGAITFIDLRTERSRLCFYRVVLQSSTGLNAAARQAR